MISDVENDIAQMVNPWEIVIDEPRIRVKYSYPLGTVGLSPLEAHLRGWIFEEYAPNEQFFTRADLARVIADRYAQIYEENERSGKYAIWGHGIGDLTLEGVYHNANDVSVPLMGS